MPDRLNVQQPVDLAQQMIPGGMILDPDPIKQVLRRLQPSRHRPRPLENQDESIPYAMIEQEPFISSDCFRRTALML
ncbi:hypothetical protein [Salipiger aestuarii]|uniref:hypothetical protein n=1 Tax=Salipiger aestuarii TaxID=568098 RepID=UPI0016815ACF|nr:hypothetical protein [Salipiger aestuarii]